MQKVNELNTYLKATVSKVKEDNTNETSSAKMAGGRLLRCSATPAVFMVVELLIQASAQRVRIINPSSSLAVASNADVKLFPGRNSGLRRRTRAHDVPPLCKLQAGLKLLNISLTASFLVDLAGDVSLNPGPETDPCALCAKKSKSRAM